MLRISQMLWVFAFAAFNATVAAQAGGPDEITVFEENDVINPFSEGTDRFYTQGLRIEWFDHHRKADDDFLPAVSNEAWCSLLCGDGGDRATFHSGFAIQQTMYTPERIDIARPQPFERPWAGLLSVSRIARATYPSSHGATRRDTIEVSLGVTGPPSLAGDTQIWWHDVIGAQRPNGWENQIGTEPILQTRYESSLRWPRESGGNADFVGRVGFNLGNALVSAESDAIFRIGWNLTGFGPSSIPGPKSFTLPNAEARAKVEDKRSRTKRSGRASGAAPNGNRRTKWFDSGNLFVRGGLSVIAHSIVLDGNTFATNDIRIDRKLLVPEVAIGAQLNLVDGFWLTGQFVHRGSEYQSIRGRDADPQEFGAITLAWIRPF
ncbi:lipid A deacylase LpxR family protein [Citromicrobium bathyomarinum]|uniref:lipid A deacylase LpxR family protein n=1 Tax=Citromicrobium bathyomarinum TaxID=72174 RepID=UPI003159F855